MRLVSADGVIARPFAVIQTLAQRERAFMKWSSDWHESLSERAIIVMLTMNEQETIYPPLPSCHFKGGYMNTPDQLTRIIKRATFTLAILCLSAAAAFAQKTDPKKTAESVRHAQEAAN